MWIKLVKSIIPPIMLRQIVRLLPKAWLPKVAQPKKIDVEDFYGFVKGIPFGSPLPATGGPTHTTLNWFVPPVGKGSGGHLNIFRFVHNLEKLGFDCRIVVCNTFGPGTGETAQKIRANISAWFFPLQASVYLYPEEDIPSAHVSIATGWQTAYPVRDFQATHHKVYFVQDFEPSFFAQGSESAFANATYHFGFTGITAGGWLADKLARDYGMTTHAVGFSYDKHLYRPLPKRKSPTTHIFFYARPPTPRRGFELGLLVLSEVMKRVPNAAVIFAGWDVGQYKIDFPHLNAGQLTLEELPDLYSQCDAALVISLTNLSLLPLELMACGCPVVSNTGDNVEWILDENNAVLAEATVETLSDALVHVLTNDIARGKVIEAGFATVAKTDWVKEAEKMAVILKGLDA